MLIVSMSRSTIDRSKKQFSFKFEMKDLEEAKKVFGMEIERNSDSYKVRLTQKRYLQKVLKKFKTNGDTRSVNTLLSSHFKLKVAISPTTVEECQYMSHISYANEVGSLLYAIVCTRFDLSQAVSMLSRYMHDPGKSQWEAMK